MFVQSSPRVEQEPLCSLSGVHGPSKLHTSAVPGVLRPALAPPPPAPAVATGLPRLDLAWLDTPPAPPTTSTSGFCTRFLMRHRPRPPGISPQAWPEASCASFSPFYLHFPLGLRKAIYKPAFTSVSLNKQTCSNKYVISGALPPTLGSCPL